MNLYVAKKSSFIKNPPFVLQIASNFMSVSFDFHFHLQVGDCLTGGGAGFCYVHMPTTCSDMIESQNFMNFNNPEGSMYISFEACRRRFGIGGPFFNIADGKSQLQPVLQVLE